MKYVLYAVCAICLGVLNPVGLYANEDFEQLKERVLADETKMNIASVFDEQLEFAQQCSNKQAQGKIKESARFMANLLQALDNGQIQSKDEFENRLHEVELLLPYTFFWVGNQRYFMESHSDVFDYSE